MKAKIKPAYLQKRIELGEVLPLETPFRMTISASQLCNFKCFFCTHGMDREAVLKTGFKYKMMTLTEFTQLADQLKQFDEPLKLIVFSGMGEPLINPDLPKMIQYLKENHIADRVEMYTNATLLTEALSMELINSGLDSLKISVEGLNPEKYKEVCQYEIDYDQFLRQIRYFYENRKQCKVYIKVIDSCLEDGETEVFYKMFGDTCDEIFIEHLSDCQPLTGDCGGIVDKFTTMYNEPAEVSKVCPLLFYSMYADADCNIYPCVTLGLPLEFSIGNFKEDSILKLWNGSKAKTLRMAHLEGRRGELPICGDCGNMSAMYHKEDDIDGYVDKIIEKM